MALSMELTFISADGKAVLGVCHATGEAGKQVTFGFSPTPKDLPDDCKVLLRAGQGLQVSLPRIVPVSDKDSERVWAKAGAIGDKLIVQMLFKKQTTGVFSLKKLVVTCEAASAQKHFVLVERITCEDEDAGLEMLLSAREGQADDMMSKLQTCGGVVPVDFQNEGGSTALHYASANGHSNCVEELLQRGARLLPNKSGNTPLHWAVQNKQQEVVALLLKAESVDVLAKNGFGRSALTDAFAAQADDITVALLQHTSAGALDGPGGNEGVVEEECDEQVEEDGAGEGGDAMEVE